MRYIILGLFSLVMTTINAQETNNSIGDTIHAIHYNIHLNEINTDNKTINGFSEIILNPIIDGIQNISLELINLTVDSVVINEMAYTFLHENEVIKIFLPAEIGTNDTLVVGVYYHGNPFHESWGGFHFSGNYAFNLGVGFESIPHNLGKTWFPCIDDFTDRATYDFFITVENDKKAICGGTLIDTIDDRNGMKTWHWQMTHPIPSYLASVAVGDYLLYRDEYFGMEDTIPIHIYTRPSQINNVEGSFIHLKEILQWYEDRFGPYPFSRVGYTGTAIGAMEHAANIAYPHSAINGNTGSESLYTHELAHMWFGDMVTCSTAEDMWLNEGWATFCEINYLNHIYGYDDFIAKMRHEHREVLRKTHRIDGDYFALNDIPLEYTYGSHAYDKGGSVTNTLRGYLGDSIFFDAMTAYLKHFEFTSVSSEDMRDFLTDYTGINMTPFFDAWVMTPGTPHFSIDSTAISEDNAQFMIDIWLKQKYKGADYLAQDNILEVTFSDEKFKMLTDTVHFSGKTGHSIKHLDFHPSEIFLDLYEKIGDATTDNYRFFTEPEEYTFPDTYSGLIINELNDSALIRFTHNWVAPDSLKKQIYGLRLSPYRHWKVEGIFPEDIQAQSKFFYDYSSYLDNHLILSDNDSVIILYRENPAYDWQQIPHSRVGNWNVGYIITDKFMKGEYTLAVIDKSSLSTNEIITNRIVNIYPNPSRGKLNFEFVERGNYNIVIYDVKGALLDQFSMNGKSKSCKWKNDLSFTGVVFIHVFEGRELLTIRKLVFTN